MDQRAYFPQIRELATHVKREQPFTQLPSDSAHAAAGETCAALMGAMSLLSDAQHDLGLTDQRANLWINAAKCLISEVMEPLAEEMRRPPAEELARES